MVISIDLYIVDKCTTDSQCTAPPLSGGFQRKDLAAAYDQLLRYRDALENPPLLIVCDLDRIVVHTNFTGTVSATFLNRLQHVRILDPARRRLTMGQLRRLCCFL